MEFLSDENKEKIAQAIKDCLASDNPEEVLEKYAEDGFTNEMLNRVIENYNVVRTINFIENNIGKSRLQEFPLLDKNAFFERIKTKTARESSYIKEASVNIDRKRFYGMLYNENKNIELEESKSFAKVASDDSFMLTRKLQDIESELADTQLKIASLLQHVRNTLSAEDLEVLKKSASSEIDNAVLSLFQTLKPQGSGSKNPKSGYAVIQSLVDLIHKLIDILQTKMAYERQKPKIQRVEKKAGLVSNIAAGFLLDSAIKEQKKELATINKEIEKTENLLALQELKQFENKLRESITFKELMQDPIISNYSEEDVKKAWNMLYRFHPEVVRNPLTAKLVIRKMLETGQLDTFDIKDISEILKNMHSLESVK